MHWYVTNVALSDSNAKIGHLQSDELIGYLGQHFEIHLENVRHC